LGELMKIAYDVSVSYFQLISTKSSI